MTLVDGPTGENDNMICVAYKHQFDLINESTGEAYRLHHVDANKVSYPNTKASGLQASPLITPRQGMKDIYHHKGVRGANLMSTIFRYSEAQRLPAKCKK